MTETFSSSALGNQTSTSSFSKTALGYFSNLSYNFSSFLYQKLDTVTQTSQQTTSRFLSESISATGTGSANPLLTTGLMAGTFPAGNTSVSENAVSQDSFSLSLLETVTQSGGSAFNDSIYESGTFSAGSYGFGSVSYGASSTSSSTRQDLTSTTRIDNATISDTSTEGEIGGNASDNFSLQAFTSFTRQNTLTQVGTVTDSTLSTHSLYEGGSFGNSSFALSSFNLFDQGAETHATSSAGTFSGAETGSNSALDTADGGLFDNSSGTFNQFSNGTSGAQTTATSGFTLSEQGSFAAGSYALSSFLLQETQGANDSSASAGTALLTYSGGADAISSSAANQSGWSGSLTEQGVYAQGSFNLTVVTYAGSGSDSNTQNADGSGQILSLSGQSGYNVSATGSFAGGSWSLSSYVMTGNSAGTFSSSVTGDGFSRDDNFQQSDTLYQAGTMNAGAYANTSYTMSQEASETVTNQYGASEDTLLTSFSALQTLTGGQSQSGSTTYSWPGTGGVVTSVSGNWATTVSVTLPGPASAMPTPDTTLVPVAAVDAAPVPSALIVAGPPVPGNYNTGALQAHQNWLSGQNAAIQPTVRNAEEQAQIHAQAAPTVTSGPLGNAAMLQLGAAPTGGAGTSGSSGSTSGSGSSTSGSATSSGSATTSGSSPSSPSQGASPGPASILPMSGMWIASGSLDIRLAGHAFTGSPGGSGSGSPSGSGSSSGSGSPSGSTSGSTGTGSGTSASSPGAGTGGPSGRSFGSGAGGNAGSGSGGPASFAAITRSGAFLPSPVLDLHNHDSSASGAAGISGPSVGAPNGAPLTQSVALAGGGTLVQGSTWVSSTSSTGSSETVSQSIGVNFGGSEPDTAGSGTTPFPAPPSTLCRKRCLRAAAAHRSAALPSLARARSSRTAWPRASASPSRGRLLTPSSR